MRASEKFCGGCGRSLTSASNTDEPRFNSPDSYTPKHLAEKILTSKSVLEGERKQVTVLFADLKGSGGRQRGCQRPVARKSVVLRVGRDCS